MNLHRLDDNNPNQHNQIPRNQWGQFARFPFMGDKKFYHPTTETYWQMLQSFLYPQYKLNSLTTIILTINTIFYGLCLIDGIEEQGTLLQAKNETLKTRGGLVNQEIKENYQYQMLLTSLFLSYDLVQYLYNQLSCLILLSHIEHATGPVAAGVIYLLGGIIGALFGCSLNCCSNLVYLHVATCVYALIGSIIGFFILNWESLGEVEGLRFVFCLLIWLITTLCLFFILGNLFSSESSSHPHHGTDYYAILGGFMAGIFLTLAVAIPMKRDTFENKASIFGYTFTLILTIISLILFLA